MKVLLVTAAALMSAVPVTPPAPVGAVLISACGLTYAAVTVFSDGHYEDFNVAEIKKYVKLEDYLRDLKPFHAQIEDPKLCGTET